MIEHTGETIDDEPSISQKLLDYGWAIPAAVGTAYVAKKGYDLYQGLKGRSITSAPQPSPSQMDQAIDVPSREVAPKAEKPNPLNAYSQEKYGVPLATLEAKTGGPLKSVADIDIVGGALSKGGNVSVNTPGAFTQQSSYVPAPVVPQVPAGQFDKSQLGQSPDPLAGRGFQQPPQSIGPVQAPIAPTPSVQAGVESGSPAKAVQSVIAKEIDKTAGMYRNAEGKMVYPEGMSPAARSGYEAFTKQYPDIAKTLEAKGQFGILGAGSGDNSLKNSYDFELAKKIRNEILGGKMVGPHGGEGGFYNATVTPAIKAISPTSELGKEIAALPEKGGTHGNLGTPATIGGAKGGLLTGKNTVIQGLKAGGPALLLMSMADAAKAATEGNMAPSKELGFDLATGAALAKLFGGPAAAAGAMAFGSKGLNTNEEKELAYLRKVGTGRGIAPPSNYKR